MAKYKVVTKKPDYDASDGVIVFPQNRTLYVDQFTDKGPFSDENRATFKASSIEDVFDHYHPQKEIELKTVDGEIVNEHFCFYSIADFEDDQLIEHSELLCQQKASDQAQDVFKRNLRHVHEQVRGMEMAYRTLDTFFSNAGQSKIDCLILMNVNKEGLKLYDSADTMAVREELKACYNRLVLQDNYSLLVVPGYLGDADTVRMWANTAYGNKVVLITDFIDCPDYEFLADALNTAQLQGQDACLTHVIMTCNYLLGREKSKMAGEEDNLYIPASGALAGRLANTEEIAISYGAAGKKYGTLSNVKGARLGLRKVQIATLIDLGVIPMIEDEGYTMAFSTGSLYNGTIGFLKEYPVIRVLDWISKVLQYLFNAKSLMNWNFSVRTDLREQIMDFLDDYKGYDARKLIENYNIKKLDKDPISKEIGIVFEIKLFCFARPLVLELTGHNNMNGPMQEDKNK